MPVLYFLLNGKVVLPEFDHHLKFRKFYKIL